MSKKLYKLNKKGKFVLRIEDTDCSRKVKGAEKYIYDVLDYYKIKVDEGPREGGEFGPYRQSERKDIYNKYIGLLIEKGHAYYCYASRDELLKARKDRGFSYNSETRMMFKNSISLEEKESLLLKKKNKYVVRLKVTADIDLIVADISLVVTKRSEFNSMLKKVDNDLSRFNEVLFDQNQISYQKITE